MPYSRRINHVLATLMFTMNAKEAARVYLTIGIRISHDALLKKDLPIILAACQFEGKNGYVEGNVNRLKMIKRLMYGRANFDLPRIRVLCRNPDPKL